MARSIQPVWVATYQAIVVAPVSLRKPRRGSLPHPPWAPLLFVGRHAEVQARRARVEIWDPGLGTRATGIRPTTQRRAPRGPRADNDGEEQPLANAQAAERAIAGGARLLDSPHRVPTAPHLVTVAMNLLPRVSWAFAHLGAHCTSSHRYRRSRLWRTGSIDPNWQGLGRPTRA